MTLSRLAIVISRRYVALAARFHACTAFGSSSSSSSSSSSRSSSSSESIGNAGDMAENNVEVCVKQGKLRGHVVENLAGGHYFAFRGIPFAKPPVGQLRFKDPQPPEPWTGVRDATRHGDHCAQVNILTRELVGSDDCLYLNVYTNCMKPPVKRAVMVWIHGGGFESGSGDQDLAGPEYLVQKDIVFVSINYRLGVLGFLNLEDEVAPGNQGLKDQVMALRWIQENIKSFGGDEQNVTIFGESAGGAAVHYLCVSSMARGLFHKAIVQSGVLVNPWAYSNHGTKYALQLAATLGEKSTDPKVIVEFLRTVDAKKLIDVQRHLVVGDEKLQFVLPFGPSNDSKSPEPFLPMSKAEALKADIKVPILIGYTSHEGLFFLAYNREYFNNVKTQNKYEMFNDEFERTVHPEVRKQLEEENITLDKYKRWYFGDGTITEDQAEQYAEMLSDAMFINGIYKVVNEVADKQLAPAYLYRFSFSEPSLVNELFDIKLPGACHGSELFYIFFPHMAQLIGKEPHKPGTKGHKIMSYFMQLWTDFAKIGDPTPVKTDLIPVKWEPLKNAVVYNYLDISDKLEVVTARRNDQRFEWANIKHKL